MTDLLEVRNLETTFFTQQGALKAVDGLSLRVRRGEIVAIVGESGCGKSVTALSILRLVSDPPGRITGGEILFEGRSLLDLSQEELRKVRGNGIAMIFQEPMTSLNPVLTVGEQIAEVLLEHAKATKREVRDRVVELLASVHIADPGRRAEQYPHELSGGMRQRVMIAIALACEPALIIADEPTTALDVTVQAQVLDLLLELRDRYGMGLILITHDLGVVAETADRVAVMYAGRKVEEADVMTLFRQPLHPYTQGLMRATPEALALRQDSEIGRAALRLQEIPGMVPKLHELPPGCAFGSRCTFATPACREAPPPLLERTPGHQVACFRAKPAETFALEAV